MKRIWPLLLIAILFVGCRREEEVIIPHNTAPPDSTITDLVLESYVNRSYITLLGARPTESQLTQSIAILRTHDVSLADRATFLGQLIAQPAYYYRTFDIARSTFLNAVDTSDIRQEIIYLDFILSDSNYLPYWQEAMAARAEFVDLLDIPTDLQNGNINMIEVHRRVVANGLYDQINMGTQNFVISMFQNFLKRYPTDAERAASETMVDGFPAQVFLVNGRTKTEFISIFLNSRDYAEGQVRDLFTRYLYREPHTEELESFTLAYRASSDYEALQISVLSLDEFVGL